LRREVEALNARLRRGTAEAAKLAERLELIVGTFCVGLARQHYHVERHVPIDAAPA
jgi:hypothetical protein